MAAGAKRVNYLTKEFLVLVQRSKERTIFNIMAVLFCLLKAI